MALWDNIADFLTNAKFSAATPQQDAKGVDWDGNQITDYVINKDDKRFIACLETAHELKAKIDDGTGKTYSELLVSLNPKNSDELAKITKIEKEITVALSDKFHAEFGDYNPAFKLAPTKEQDYIPSLHNDISRANKSNPVNLNEFQKDELICRHIAPIANILLAEAGMDVARYGVFTGSVVLTPAHEKGKDGNDMQENPNIKYKAKNAAAHAIIISKLTGNVIDFTSRDSLAAYKPAVKKISGAEFEDGADLVTSINNGNLTLFKMMPKDSIRADALIESMNKKLSFIADQANLADLALNDTLKQSAHSEVKHTGSELIPPRIVNNNEPSHQQIFR